MYIFDSPILIADFEIFCLKNEKKYYFSENAGFQTGLQNEHNIACPKNDLTTVFVAQRTGTSIKNGVYA